MIIKKFKLFEGVEDDLIFSLSEEDITDMFLPLTDIGSIVKIENKFYTDGKNSIEVRDRDFMSKVHQEELYGVYRLSVKIFRKDNELEDTKFFDNGIYNTKFYKVFIDTILQISKRVENVEWEPENSSTIVKVMIVCQKKKYDTIIKKDIVRNSYKSNFNDILNRKVKNILSDVCELCTDAFCAKRIDMPFIVNSQHEKTMDSGFLYLYFADMPKATVTINGRKSGRLIEDIETFRKKDIPNIEIPSRAKYVMTININYDKLVRNSKLEAKRMFI